MAEAATPISKEAYKKILETGSSLGIPARLWRAFLAPERTALKKPSDLATVSLLNILYGLETGTLLLPKTKYTQWMAVADYFGLWKLRYLLEDGVFKHFDPENYALFESVVEKQMFIEEHLVVAIRAIVAKALADAGIGRFSIENRRKNIYGVYKKVALKGKSINEIYDIHGFRILVPTTADCYRAVEILHRLWRPFPDRYKDYIAAPKENGYQSIHTLLSCLEKKITEFQIRTYTMDRIADSGPANHAEYKKTKARKT